VISPPERLAETRRRIDAMLPNVPFDGWTLRSLRAGLAAAGMPEDERDNPVSPAARGHDRGIFDLADRRMTERPRTDRDRN